MASHPLLVFRTGLTIWEREGGKGGGEGGGEGEGEGEERRWKEMETGVEREKWWWC